MYAGRDHKNQGMTTWCAGLPLTDERRLGREEREQLRRTAWKFFGQGLGLCFGLMVVGVLLIVLTWKIGGAWSGTLFVIAILVAALLLFLPACLFARESRPQRGLRLLRDLHRGYVVVFEGTLTESDLLQSADATDVAQSRLLALGLLDLECSELQSVEVLPVSRSVWRVGGERVIPWVQTRWRQVADPQESASSWLHASATGAIGDAATCRRLSVREHTELKREARQHWLPSAVTATLLTACGLPLLVLALVHFVTAGKWTVSAFPWQGLHLVWLAIASDLFFVTRWRQARELYQDLRGGEVVSSTDIPSSEILPYSGRLWTQRGRPASWRRIGK